MFAHVHVTCMYTTIRMHACMHVCSCVCMLTCMHTCWCICRHACMHISLHIYAVDTHNQTIPKHTHTKWRRLLECLICTSHFCNRVIYSAALLRKKTCNLRHPMHLRHPVLSFSLVCVCLSFCVPLRF